MALKGVMLGELYETSARDASAIRWYDGRALSINFNSLSYVMHISISELGSRDGYNSITSKPVTTIRPSPNFHDGSSTGLAQYELNKW